MINELTSLVWPPPEAVRPALQELFNHSAVISAALQLLASACVDMLGTFKQQQQKWRQQKAALKAAAAARDAAVDGKGRKKRDGVDEGAEGAAAAAALAKAGPLLKLTIPADHADAGLPAGWEQGLEPWRRQSEPKAVGPDWTLAALFCQHAIALLKSHYIRMLKPDSWEPATVFLNEKDTDEVLSVHLAKLPVMRLLLEAVLLLQATAPGSGVHEELGLVLYMAVQDAPVAAREQLRQRGLLLLLQGLQLLDPEGGDEGDESNDMRVEWQARDSELSIAELAWRGL
jgi:hypothetical protein